MEERVGQRGAESATERGGESTTARGGDPATARAWLEVDLGALRRNAAALRERLRPGTRLLPMVKADAYGLGAARVAGALAGEGAWGFGVATVDEGAELRRAGIEERVVVFTPCAPLDAPRLLEWRLEPVATSLGALRAYAGAADAAGAPLGVHLEVDTGMGRFGLPAEGVGEWAPEIREALDGGRLRLASTFTHFHSAESDPVATRAQWARFQTVLEVLRAAGVEPGLRHAANSAAVLKYPEVHADLVRPGLFLYGGEAAPSAPAEDADPAPEAGGDRPEPVTRVRARVLDVRDVPAGATVSYGATFRAARPMRLATLGIGYADGLPHALSNRGEALVAGRRVPFVGRVCMDMTCVDVTGVEHVNPGTEATLLGREGSAEIGLGELARLAGRIPYEVLTSFSVRLPRITIAGAKEGRGGADRGGSPPGDGGGARPAEERIEEHGVEREQPA